MPSTNKIPTKKKTNLKKDSKVTVDIYVPKFDDLWNNHPYRPIARAISFFDNISSSAKIKPICEGKNGKSNFENTCAINLSYTLKKSGVNLSSFKGATCGHHEKKESHIIRAEELANWLKNSKPFGDAIECEIIQAKDFKEKIK